MRGLLILLSLCATAFARDLEPAVTERVFLELEASRTTVFVQETLRLRLRIGIDRAFLRENVVPLFRRPMDVPLQVLAPWLEDLPGATRLEDGMAPDVGASLALNDDLGAFSRVADRMVNGRPCLVLEIERAYRPEEAGTIEIPAPRLRFAYGTEFEDDFVHGRRAVDRRDATVDGERLTVRVEPWPDEGRPRSFDGAVGRFTIRAEASTRDLIAGESLELLLVIEGDGNLAVFGRPRLEDLAGFHVYGVIDDRGPVRRTIAYDLAPLDESVTEIPALALAYLDPGPPAGFHEAWTEAIPLRVRRGDGTAAVGPRNSEEPDAEEEGVSPFLLVAAVLLAALAVGGALLWRAARTRDRPDRDELRARGAAAAFFAAIDEPGLDLAEAFAEYLAANLRRPTAAVIAPELPARLADAGVPPDLATRVADLLESLVGSRYGGRADTDRARGTACELVDELEASFRPTPAAGEC